MYIGNFHLKVILIVARNDDIIDLVSISCYLLKSLRRRE